MDIFKLPRRRYRSWKHRNQFDKGLLILTLDAMLFLAKVLLLASVLYIFWIFVTKLKVSPLPEELEQQSAESRRVTTASPISAVSHNKSQPLAQIKKPNQDEAKTNKLVGASWLMNQEPQKFTIQYAASTQYNELDDFLPIINTDDPLAIYAFRLTKEGVPLLGLATGIFDSLESARDEVSSLSSEATVQDPWIRRIADLQRDVRETKQPEVIAAILRKYSVKKSER